MAINYSKAIDWILSEYRTQPSWGHVKLNKAIWLDCFEEYKPTKDEIINGMRCAISDMSAIGKYPPTQKPEDYLLLCKNLPVSEMIFKQCLSQSWGANEATKHMKNKLGNSMRSCDDRQLKILIETKMHKVIQDVLHNRHLNREKKKEEDARPELSIHQKHANMMRLSYLVKMGKDLEFGDPDLFEEYKAIMGGRELEDFITKVKGKIKNDE